MRQTLERVKSPFNFLRTDRKVREQFLQDLSQIIEATEFSIVSVVIDKRVRAVKYAKPINPYHLNLRFGLERLNEVLVSKNQEGKEITIFFEQRGAKEDKDLELEFLRNLQ